MMSNEQIHGIAEKRKSYWIRNPDSSSGFRLLLEAEIKNASETEKLELEAIKNLYFLSFEVVPNDDEFYRIAI
jgi:hypothetical protein